MALQTTAQFPGLQAQVQPAIQQGLATRQAIQAEENKRRLREQEAAGLATRQRALGVPSAAPEGETQVQAELRLIADNPDVADKLLKSAGIASQSQREDASRFAGQALAVTDIELQNTLINQRAQAISARGGDPSHTISLLDQSPEERQASLQGLNQAALTAAQRAKTAAKGLDGGPSEVQSSTILPGGVVQIVRKDGTVEIKSPEAIGEDIIKRAEERGVKLQQQRAQGRGLGKDAAKVSSETVKQVGILRSNNASLRQVVREVEGGAETGPLAAKIPSFKAESVRLDQLRNKLGLDVVGSVTFGALSEGELNLALSTALPTKLDGPELVTWAQEKIAAQEKLATYMEDQAIFLSVLGNTPAGWLELQRSRGGQPEAPSTVGRFTVEVVQ